MAKVTLDEVKHLGRLARIAISEPEAKQMTKELDAILDYVGQLQKVDTTNIEPTSQVTGLTDVWREDTVKPCELDRQKLLDNVPHTHEGYIKVKKVL